MRAALLGWLLAAVPALACAPEPLAPCGQPTVPSRATLQLRDRTPDTGDTVNWRWLRGGETPAGAFGNPVAAGDVALCLYDESGSAPALVFAATAPADGLCAGAPCWSARADGTFRYRDREQTPEGIDQVVLHPGAAGKAKVTVRGAGVHLADRPLGLPALPLALPLRVQVQAGAGCWEAVYVAASRNEPGRFKSGAGVPPPPPTTTTTTTLPPPGPTCLNVPQAPASCTVDADCPAGYTCAAGACRGGACDVRADCPREGECVHAGGAAGGTCVCWGCGAHACLLGCNDGLPASGCRCVTLDDCPPPDDVCFFGLCS